MPASLLADVLDDAGYGALVDTVTLNVGGMTCASCVGYVEQALAEVPGVVSSTVNLATERATVCYLSGAAGVEQLREAVDDAGYSVDGVVGDTADESADSDRLARTREIRDLKRKVFLAGAVGVILMTLMYIPLEVLDLTSFQLNLILWVMATPVQFWAGAQFLPQCLGRTQTSYRQHGTP